MSVRLLCQSSHLKVSYKNATPEEIQKSENIIITNFRAEDTTLKRTWAVKKGMASAVRSFYIQDNPDPKLSKNLLPVGFLSWLAMYYEEQGIEFEIVEMRTFPKVDKEFAINLFQGDVELKGPSGEVFTPRDYQIEAALSLVRAKVGLAQAPVGSGKGLILALLCKLYSQHKILCLFNSIDLVHQTYKNFIQYGIDAHEIGIIQGQNVQDDRRITLLSVASYEKAFHIFPEMKVLLVDESHSLSSGTGDEMATKILYSCQNAPIRLGLSATQDAIDNPYRQMALYGNMGPIVFDQHIQDKIEEGSLSPVRIEMHTISGFAIPVTRNWADSYDKTLITSKKQRQKFIDEGKEVYTEDGKEYYRELTARGDESNLFVFNEIRNDKIAEIASKTKHTVVLYTRREHGIILEEKIKKLVNEERVKRIDGYDDGKIRDEAKSFLSEHPENIVLASSVWDTGVDVPWIHTLITTGGGVSTSRTIQKLGRSTRNDKKSHKVEAVVIDFMDLFSGVSNKQSQKRLKTYEEKLRFKVEMK